MKKFQWKNIDSMPTDRPVLIKSATGIICKAKVQHTHHSGIPTSAKIRKDKKTGIKRVSCFKYGGGDIVAIAWAWGEKKCSK